MKKAFFFVDTEYAFTCSRYEQMVPNYRSIFAMFDKHYAESYKIMYFVGNQSRKKGIQNFLIKLGAHFLNVHSLGHASKIQVVGSAMAIDVAERISEGRTDWDYVFLSGNDYMIPIVARLNKLGIEPYLYYFPLILSRDLETVQCRIVQLSSAHMTYTKEQNADHPRIH